MQLWPILILFSLIIPSSFQENKYNKNRRRFGKKVQNYEVYYGWKEVDYNFKSPTHREKMVVRKQFIPENNIITAIKISGNRMFLSTPRYRKGVPSTFNYVPYDGDLPSNNTGPPLNPYPTWEMQKIGNCSALQSVQAMEVDQFQRLWILDIGRINLFDQQPISTCPSKVVLIDLKEDKVLDMYTFPNDVITSTDGFPKDLTVACTSPTRCVLYIADITEARIVLYDHEKRRSWFVTHPTMGPDPKATNITILGKTYYNPFGISSIGLAPRRNKHDTFYYAALASFTIYKVKTKDLLSAVSGSTLPSDAVTKFGIRPSQSDGMTMDAAGRLYYGSLQHDAVFTWNTNKRSSKARVVAQSDVDIVWQDTFGFDNERRYLFLITDRFQFFEGRQYNFKDVNFRALRFPILSKSYIYPA